MDELAQKDALQATQWLEDASPNGAFCGYDPPGWPANVWLLHAMYESDEIPAGLNHDEVERIEKAAGTRPKSAGPLTDFDAVLEDMLEQSCNTGVPLGTSSAPGHGWKRLFWRELWGRLGLQPSEGNLPEFPYESWPANIRPPARASLDREQFVTLVDHLGGESERGFETPCSALFAGILDVLNTGSPGARTVYTCELRELIPLYDLHAFAPANIWPHDRAWFTYTDYDLWMTKVSGTADLVQRLIDEPELEAFELQP